MRLDDAAGEHQPQAHPARVAGPAAVGPEERGEQARLVGGVDPDPASRTVSSTPPPRPRASTIGCPASEYLHALSSRLSSARRSSAKSADRVGRPVSICTSSWRSGCSTRKRALTSRTSSSASTVSRRSGVAVLPARPLARSRRAAVRMSPTRRSSSFRSAAISFRQARAFSSSPSAAMSSATRIRASGVRSSWETFASNSFSARTRRSRRAAIVVEGPRQVTDLVLPHDAGARSQVPGAEPLDDLREPRQRRGDLPSQRDRSRGEERQDRHGRHLGHVDHRGARSGCAGRRIRPGGRRRGCVKAATPRLSPRSRRPSSLAAGPARGGIGGRTFVTRRTCRPSRTRRSGARTTGSRARGRGPARSDRGGALRCAPTARSPGDRRTARRAVVASQHDAGHSRARR